MTWQFSDGTNSTININPATGAEAIWRLKQMLKQMGAMVTGSGDGGSLYQLHPGPSPYSGGTHYDVLTGYGTGANGLNNSQAWFILKLPSGRFLAFQRGSSGANYWRIVYLPLTTPGGAVQTLNAGSATAMALSSTDVNYLKGTSVSTAGAQYFGTDATYRQNMSYDDDTKAFWMVCWAAGSGITESAGGAFCYDPLLVNSFPSEDTDPVVIYCPDFFNSSGNQAWRANALSSEGNYAPKAYLRRGMTGESFVVIPALVYCNSSGTAVFPGGAGSNPHNFKDDGLPIIYARRASVGVPAGYKGASTFLRWLAANRGTGQAMTLSVAKDRIAVADVSLPWDASTVPLV